MIGRVFWRSPVRELLEGEAPDFAVLEARDFIRRRSGSTLAGEREFAFKHALTRDVAYSSLPKASRARLHAAFAGWLERIAEGRDEQAAFLAHHFAEAVRPEDADLAWPGRPEELERLRGKAVAWLKRAADLAVARYELDEAIGLYERALAYSGSEDVQAALWRSIGHANALKYDGDEMWKAMQNAIELTADESTLAELYSELAWETSCRSGMWRRMPDHNTVDDWIETALELALPGSAARARALIAKSFWNPFGSSAYAIEASQIAERLDDVELRSHAWDVRGITEFVSGRYDHGRAFAERRFELLDRISDPDHRADIYSAPISGCIWGARFNEARRLARLHDETTAPLTPHHRLHGVAILAEVEELLGAWERIRELAPRTVEAVAANAATPCVRNARSLLVCAAASAYLGDEAAARRHEEDAEGLGIEGYGVVLDIPRLRLALIRGDLDAVGRAPRNAAPHTRLVPGLDGPRDNSDSARRPRGDSRPRTGGVRGRAAPAAEHLPRAVRAPHARGRSRGRGVGAAGAGPVPWARPRVARGADSGAALAGSVPEDVAPAHERPLDAERELAARGGDRLGDALAAAERRAVVALRALERGVQEVGVEEADAGPAVAPERMNECGCGHRRSP